MKVYVGVILTLGHKKPHYSRLVDPTIVNALPEYKLSQRPSRAPTLRNAGDEYNTYGMQAIISHDASRRSTIRHCPPYLRDPLARAKRSSVPALRDRTSTRRQPDANENIISYDHYPVPTNTHVLSGRPLLSVYRSLCGDDWNRFYL